MLHSRLSSAVRRGALGLCSAAANGLVVVGGLAPVGGPTYAAPPHETTTAQVAGTLTAMTDQVRSGLRVGTVELAVLKVDTTPNRPLSVQVPIDGVVVTLDMVPHSVRDDLYQVIEHREDGSYVQVKPAPVNTLRGFIPELPGAKIAGGVLEEGLFAQVVMPDGRHIWIQPASTVVEGASEGLHAIYSGGDPEGPSAMCTTPPDSGWSGGWGGDPGVPINDRGGTLRFVAQLACEAEFQFFRDSGSSTRTQATINLMVNIVNSQYEREVDIRHTITTILIRTFQNYNTSLNMREQFMNNWNATQGGVVRDLAIQFDGNGNGGQATGNGLICVTNMAYAGIGCDWPNLSYRCDVLSHEMGHLWGACHCPACDNPPYTMHPIVNYANRFLGAPGNECGSQTILQIFAHRNSRNCLTTATATTQVPNDLCSNAVAIPCDPNDRSYVCTFGFDNINATRDGPTDGCRPGDRDIWYRYTATCDRPVTFSTCGSNFDTVLFAYNDVGCGVTLANQIACDDDFGCSGFSLSSQITFNVVRGGSYLIRVAGFNNQQGSGLLTITQGICFAPFNDSCGSSISVLQGEDILFSTVGATTGTVRDTGTSQGPDSFLETAGNCGSFGYLQIGSDIWYNYTPPCSGTTRFSLCGSSFDTKIAVYSGCPTTDYQALGCNDDSCGVQSSLDVALTAGVQYLIRIGGHNEQAGAGTLRITSLNCERPANDACSQAIVLGTSGFAFAYLRGATHDGSSTCGLTNSSNDIWYSFTAPCGGVLLAATCGSNDFGGVDAGVDTVLSVHSACPGTTGNELPGGCNDDASTCGGQDAGLIRDSSVSVALASGQTVLVRVSHYGGVTLPNVPAILNWGFTCDPTGACCAAVRCTVTSEAECIVASGVWTADGACDPDPCPVPMGSCCAMDGACEITTEEVCAGAGGMWTFAGVCDPNTCNVPSGSCCAADGACATASEPDCLAGDGIWTLDGVCDPNTCEVATGACCCGSTCSITIAGSCVGTGTSFAGPGTVCSQDGSATAPCCKSDYNQSGGPPTVQDIFDFLSAYFASETCADFNGGGVSVQDIFDFLAAYFAGCS